MSTSDSREASSVLGMTQQNNAAGISKIPVELLADIFFHVVSHPSPSVFESTHPMAEPDSELIRSSHSTDYASCASPYAISHVCSHWREIALSSSNLWTQLCVVLPTHEELLPLLHLWIERAKDRPLELSIQEPSDQGCNGRPGYSRKLNTSRVVFDLFLSLIERWKSIDISLSHTPLEHLINPNLLSSLLSSDTILQNLESIRVSSLPRAPEHDFHSGLESRRHSQVVPLIASLLHQSPYLRNATWGNLDFVKLSEPARHTHPPSSDHASSFSQTSSLWPTSLSELTIHEVHCEDISALLTSLSSECPVLQKLCIMKSEQPRRPYASSPNNAPPPASSFLSSPWGDSQETHGIARGHVDGRLSNRPSKILLQNLNTLFLVFEDKELPAIFDAVILPSLTTLCLSSSSSSSTSQPLDETPSSGSITSRESISNSTRNRKRWSRLSAWAWCSLSTMLQRSDAKLDTLKVGGVDLCDHGRSFEVGEIWQPYWR
ncbi:hypothetical protein CPB83DRAFT_905447 [Crepidotus variabilis]|uniref:F-box domain-containing protein n=1 Tax=Crepidotus variabilis TaxID=179855 RepID=A0A9P6JQX8_9AGAR|nr:hypothetical protein CPB83DRAFT_905447 [Crepidotus variabilis]